MLLLFFTVACLQLGTGCKKGFLDVNYNPRDLTEISASPDIVLPALLESCIPVNNSVFLYEWMGYWSHWNIPTGTALVTYNRLQVNEPGQLCSPVVVPLAEIIYLENKSRITNQQFYLGIAKVIKAIQWSFGVDLINNMPYSQAYDPAILQPVYDDGKLIYENLLKQLDSASTLIKNATELQSVKINVADIMFHGDKVKWAKFINTLKLRLLVHQANKTDRQAYITAEINRIKAEGSGFLGTGENASVNPGYNEKYPNRLSQYFGYFSSHNYQFGGGFFDVLTQVTSTQLAHANLYSMELLKTNNDPRLELFYSTIDIEFPEGSAEPYAQSEPKQFRGNRFGFSNNQTTYPYQDGSYVSAVGGSRNVAPVNTGAQGIIKGRNMDDWILTSTESLFLQAEAVQRGWITGDAEQAYKDAVKESFRWLNAGGNSADPSLSDAVFDQWYDAEVTAGNTSVSWASAPDKYKLLMLQKYIAFNGIEPLETWTDYRRNGRFPNIPISAAPGLAGNSIPIRVLYNVTEYVSNPTNVNAQGQIDPFTSKIWWMP